MDDRSHTLRHFPVVRGILRMSCSASSVQRTLLNWSGSSMTPLFRAAVTARVPSPRSAYVVPRVVRLTW